jgi:hypothetical protein
MYAENEVMMDWTWSLNEGISTMYGILAENHLEKLPLGIVRRG